MPALFKAALFLKIRSIQNPGFRILIVPHRQSTFSFVYKTLPAFEGHEAVIAQIVF